jgi:hypothetical protein
VAARSTLSQFAEKQSFHAALHVYKTNDYRVPQR